MQKITLRQFAGIALVSTLALATASAQTTSQTPPSKSTETVTSRPAPSDPVGQPVNIKLDVTITDQTGPGDPVRKVVTMVVADRGNGSIRSGGLIRSQGPVRINIDASPILLQNGAIRLRLGLEYNPRVAGGDGPAESSLNEQITVILDAGKSMIVSQAADPASDRKIMVEVRATLMK
ncbi:MAG: hypothetical protein H0W18_07560 [Acidobacteria bacterium]|nr:hypothetical protein [Acidobacteriota bacterium]